MAAIDYKSAIDTQAWALLEANATFLATFPVQCRLKDDNKQPMQQNLMIGVNDKTFIRIEVQDCRPIASGGGKISGVPFNFGMNDDNFTYHTVDVVIPCEAKMICEMQFDDSVVSKTSRLSADALVRSIWLSKFPSFGLSYCSDFSISDTKRKRQMNGKPIVSVTQTLNFHLRPYLSTLSA